jgi:hypothetical protein
MYYKRAASGSASDGGVCLASAKFELKILKPVALAIFIRFLMPILKLLYRQVAGSYNKCYNPFYRSRGGLFK